MFKNLIHNKLYSYDQIQIGEEYKWLDDWPNIYTNWGANEPGNGEGCVAMEADGRWNDTLCNKAFPFVCKVAKGTQYGR